MHHITQQRAHSVLVELKLVPTSNASSTLENSFQQRLSQTKVCPFLVNRVKGRANLEKPPINLREYPAKPRKLLISKTDSGVPHFITASTLEGFTAIPPLDITCPRKLTSLSQNSHLDNLA
ncbi:hypothetical protein QL285_010251 [Trifolium repens]|nr:hypothetical protein QL285_010251 [Trifolium repens]